MNTKAVVLSVLSVAGLASVASADFVVPNGVNYPWVRGTTANSTYAQWDVFTSVAGPNAPDVGQSVVGSLAAGAPAFNVSASGAGATVLGSGNIYGAGGALSVVVTVPSFGLGDGMMTTVLFQTRTQGTEINPATVLIGNFAPSSVTELSRVSLGGQGAMVDTLWQFNLPGSASSYTVTFSSVMQFFSLDRISVDTFTTVPTPAAAGLLGLGALASGRRRR